ncbi:DegV family protein [Bacillus sp. OV166]|uniref:DegV family protein n=1 Tax=Bacillus sp. OV166 TaxID=1882763 RepID=UPI000B446F2E|nr:DegV family protein [Bacillus sp. OV166]
MNAAKIAWITDTTASLSKEFIEQNNIHVVPLNIVINQESYKETIDITQKEFYERMKHEDSKFQTTQPAWVILWNFIQG